MPKNCLACNASCVKTAIAEPVARYAIELVRATRKEADGGHPDIAPLLRWGGPRAGQAMVLAAKARATLAGRNFVTLDDIRAAAPAVLRHRPWPVMPPKQKASVGTI